MPGGVHHVENGVRFWNITFPFVVPATCLYYRPSQSHDTVVRRFPSKAIAHARAFLWQVNVNGSAKCCIARPDNHLKGVFVGPAWVEPGDSVPLPHSLSLGATRLLVEPGDAMEATVRALMPADRVATV